MSKDKKHKKHPNEERRKRSMGTTDKAGLEGQTYQNKRTKKICVLESQDLKCKTVMLRDEEGNSISQTFPTFRRDWRKYDGETNLKTSTQKTEEAKEKEVAEKKAVKAKAETGKKEPAKKERVEKDRKTRVAWMNSMKAAAEDASAKKSYESFKITTKQGEAIAGKNARTNLFEAWAVPEKNNVVFFIKKAVFDKLKAPASFAHATKETWNLSEILTATVKDGNLDQVNKFIGEIVSKLDEFTKKPEKPEKKSGDTPKVQKPVAKKATTTKKKGE